VNGTGFDARTARTWAEVDTGALETNAAALRRLAGSDGEAVAVVKADGYGHGAISVARAAARAGIGHFAVASVAEALELRQAGIRGEVYTLSSFLPEEADSLVRADVVPFVSSSEQAEALEAAAKNATLPARCFLVVDTGMGREGLLPDDARRLWTALRRSERLRVTGIITHFSRADEPGEGDAVTTDQAGRFFDFLRTIRSGEDELASTDDGRGGRGVWLSLANSPGTLRLSHPPLPPGARGYLMRGGLLLYGIEPYRGAFDGLPDLKPVLSWRARVTLVRDLPAGATVGYGQTHTLARPSRIATLPVGYADGLSRRLSNRGVILVRGRRYPIVGRVSMDQCQIDVTDAGGEVQVGDVAALIGTDGVETQTVLDYAEAVGTTPHEPTCALTRRVPRLYQGGAG
jgi:alanine racemase